MLRPGLQRGAQRVLKARVVGKGGGREASGVSGGRLDRMGPRGGLIGAFFASLCIDVHHPSARRPPASVFLGGPADVDVDGHCRCVLFDVFLYSGDATWESQPDGMPAGVWWMESIVIKEGLM